MKRQVDLHIGVLTDQLELLGLDTSRDIATLMSRVEHDGERFLTIDLPSLGEFLEQGLSSGALPSAGCFGFGRTSNKDVRPRFMHGLWSMVFNSWGVLLENPSTHAVRALRQICYLHKKLKELPSPEKVEAALQQYVETDKSLSDTVWPEELDELFDRVVYQKWGRFFDSMESVVFHTQKLEGAKHGPGVVADRLSSNGKWSQRKWTERLEQWFPAMYHLASTYREIDDIEILPPGHEIPARVLVVPKTAKSPRVICAEPVYNQFIQQGLADLFGTWMDRHRQVSNKDQEPNKELAKAGSITGLYSTIDLSEASDRVSLQMVKKIFRRWPNLLGSILACRSMTSQLPSGQLVQLRKFASMGSALTFPIETIVFATIAEMAVRLSPAPETKPDGISFRVYGDDIVIHTYAANALVGLLPRYGLVVNRSKSFYGEGPRTFRESCGGDFFDGFDVTPIRLKERLPQERSHVERVIAIVAFRNLYCKKYGPTEFVTSLDEFISSIIPFPEGYETTPALVRWSNSPVPHGMDEHFQRPTVKAVTPQYTYREDPLDGEGALLKFFWTPFQEDPKHLQYAGRPVSAKLKYRNVLL